MVAIAYKTPDEVKDYSIDYTAVLDPGEAILTSIWTTSDPSLLLNAQFPHLLGGDIGILQHVVHHRRGDHVGVIGVFRDGPRHAFAVDDVRRVLVLAPLVAMRAHGEALREEGDMGESHVASKCRTRFSSMRSPLYLCHNMAHLARMNYGCL